MTNKEDNSTSELGIVTEEPEFQMINHENTRILPGKIRQWLGKTNNQFDKFVEVVRKLNINMPLIDAIQEPTYALLFQGRPFK